MHMRKHTGERPFVCHVDACNRVFTRADALSKHLKNLHGMSNLALNVPGAVTQVVEGQTAAGYKRKLSESQNDGSPPVIIVANESLEQSRAQMTTAELQEYARNLKLSLVQIVDQAVADVTLPTDINRANENEEKIALLTE